MKNNKLCKKLCDMVDLYQNSEHPINEILSAMKLNIQDILEENLTKHDSRTIQSATFDNPEVQASFERLKAIIKKEKINVMKLFAD